MGACYRVEHVTRYEYDTPVAMSQHMAYLAPRELAHQHVRQHELRIEPSAAVRSRRLDYFGNTVDQFQILKPHSTLVVVAESVVDVQRAPRERLEIDGPSWEDLRRELREVGATGPEVAQFGHPSPYVLPSPEVEAFAAPSFPPGRSVAASAIDLMHRIHERFVFDSTATAVTTPLTRVLEADRGVCQDFAHVGIACVRAMGLPARYVSGYLLTDPPPGQPRLVGADASHAWLSVYCPENGWIDLDPTNDLVVSDRHVTVAWGRDYGDVAPLRGVLLGGAEHQLYVGVTVRIED
jgi:transglutaminase-like putative cysteine protease